MKRYHIIAAVLGGIVLAVVVAYAAFGLLLVGFDVASYTSDGVAVEGMDYDAVLENAESAGYTVERVDSSGFHPPAVDDLEADLGPEYEAFRVILEHSASKRLWATFFADEGLTEVTLFVDDAGGPVTAEDLPPDAWVLDQLTLLFEMDEQTAATHLADLKAEMNATDPSDPGAHSPSMHVREPVDFPAIYAHLDDRATRVETETEPGTGWHERRYVVDDRPIGGIDFVISRATITHREDGYVYRVHVDYHGGVRVEAEARAYRAFEEEQVRGVYREMFAELGIPPDTIDHLHLEYRGSVW